jgi:acetyl-CoA carboxylase biotin carboxyl carrier protein
MQRGFEGGVTTVTTSAPVAQSISVAAPVVPSVSNVSVESVSTPKTGDVINSPMVGTFYSSPSPESPAFVSVGDVVKKGKTLCILEAMKIMNEVEAEFDCKIVEIRLPR